MKTAALGQSVAEYGSVYCEHKGCIASGFWK